jgi:membrane protein
VVSIAVLIGAALNASLDTVWPQDATAKARNELVRRLSGVLPARITDRYAPRAAEATEDG